MDKVARKKIVLSPCAVSLVDLYGTRFDYTVVCGV